MIKAILTDIEGTTSSLSFVKEVLFPYARAHIADFVRKNRQQQEVSKLLEDAKREDGRGLNFEALIKQLVDWIDRDQKVTPLKSMQGLIWEAGYQQGDFQGHIYADAVDTLRKWKEQGIDLFVYSSGSVHAQKLLFAHTEYGDLTPLFSGYFDTYIGGKKEITSYQRIAGQIQELPQQILFLSDLEDELDAARQAGFNTCWLARDREKLDPKAAHRQARSFTEISVAMFC